MKPRNSLIILVILVIGFGLMSFAISRGNRDLEKRLTSYQSNSVAGPEGVSRMPRRGREETVGDLWNRNPVPRDARGMLKMIAFLQQDLRLFPGYQLQRYLEELSLAELRALRRELSVTPWIPDRMAIEPGRRGSDVRMIFIGAFRPKGGYL